MWSLYTAISQDIVQLFNSQYEQCEDAQDALYVLFKYSNQLQNPCRYLYMWDGHCYVI